MAIRLGIGIGTQDSAGGGGGPPPAFTETKSILFDGVDDVLSGGAAPSLTGTGPFSLSVWMKTSAPAPYQSAVAMTNGVTLEYSIGFSSTEILGMMRDTAAINRVIASTGGPYLNGVWHCVVLSWDGVDLILDINGGDERIVLTPGNTRMGGGTDFNVGQYGNISGLYMMGGNVDEPAYWGRALSAAECIEIHNSGTPIDLSTHSAAADLVSWWRMGDWPGDSTDSTNPAARVYDAIGSVDLTPTNTTAGAIVLDVPPSPPFVNDESYAVDGVSQYALGPDVADFDFDIGAPFTISAWIRNTNVEAATLVSKVFGAPSYRGYWLGMFQGFPIVQFYHDYTLFRYGQATGSKYCAQGRWIHVVYTWDGNATGDMNGLKIYVDGVADTLVINANSLASTSFNPTGTPLRVGNSTYGGYLGPGGFDEVSVFNVEKSAAEVLALFNSGEPTRLTGEAGLVSWWRMGEDPSDSTDPAGTPQLTDVVSGHNLVPQNPLAADITNKVVNVYSDLVGMSFDGIDDYAYIGPVASPPSLDRTDSWTFSCWIKTTGGIQQIFGRADSFSPYKGWGLTVEPGGELGFYAAHDFTSGNYLYVTSTTATVNSGAWTHVAVSYDGASGSTASNVALYVNGAPVAMTTAQDNLSSGIITGWIPMAAGLRNSTGGVPIPFGGHMDELALFQGALLASDITAIYGGGSPPDLEALGSYASVLAWWRMGDADDWTESVNGQLEDETGNYPMQPINTLNSNLGTDVP